MKPAFKLGCAASRGIVALAAALALANAASQSVPSQTLIGWQLFRDDRALPAAEAWSQAANRSAQRRSAAGQREAAFANVLATIAYEKANDERAYARWADATRLYLEADMTWERDRDALRLRWSALERQLAQVSNGSAPTLRGDEQMLADLVKRANLTHYNGPRAGLSNRRDETAGISNITPQYFSGASLADAVNDVNIPQSRYTASADMAAVSDVSAAVQITGRPIPDTVQRPATRSALTTGTGTAPAPTEPYMPERILSAAPADPEVPQLVRGRPMAIEVAAALQGKSALAQRADGIPRQFQAGHTKGRTLSAAERATALQAWRYVMANRQSSTGLVNGKDAYPVSSVADMAQTIAAYGSALALQFIERESFEADMRQLLGTLRELPLYNRELFNRDYDSRNGRMLDLNARSSEVGSGWAAEDIGRLLLWLRVLGNTAPDLAHATEAVVRRLRLSRLVSGGRLYSALNQGDHERVVNDLRLGRQQVTAAALSVWGVVLPTMFDYGDAVIRRVGVVAAPGDLREGAVSPEVFARGIVELGGIDGCFESAARAMLSAQHALAVHQLRPVMVADEFLDRAPWFVYGALSAGGEEWRVASFDQQLQPTLANFSLKAAYLWSAIDAAPQTLRARALAEGFERSERGLYGGRYQGGQLNLALTLDTNASVLLAAQYAQQGQPMLRVDNPVAFSCPGLREVK